MRTFDTGATRDSDEGKLDYEGFFSPLVVERYAQYMHKHRKQSDGNLRDSDNWQKGIPLTAYMKSGWRHFVDWWFEHRGLPSREGIEDALCGVLFNAMGYLHEILKKKALIYETNLVPIRHPSRQCVRDVTALIASLDGPADPAEQAPSISVGMLERHDPVGHQATA